MIHVQKKQKFVNYVPISERDLPVEEQTVLVMKVLSRRKLLETQQESVTVARDGQISMPLTIGVDLTVRQLSGWRNVCDEDGNPLPFSPERKSELFDMLPVEIQEELAMVFQSGRFNEEGELEMEVRNGQQALLDKQRRATRDALRVLREDSLDASQEVASDTDEVPPVEAPQAPQEEAS